MAGVRRKCEKQRLITGKVIEDRGQKSRLLRSRPQILRPKAAECHKPAKPLRLPSQKAQNLDRHRFGVFFGEFGLPGGRARGVQILHDRNFLFVNFYSLMTLAAKPSRAWSLSRESGDP